MKTNIEFVNGMYSVLIGFAEFLAGYMKDGDPIIETCDVYRTVEGAIFGYCYATEEVVANYGKVHPVGSSFWHHNLTKRGRHSNSHNKQAVRKALPF